MANATTPTFPGRSIIWSRMKGLGTEPLNIGWGIGTTTGSSNSDVNLFSPATETRVAGGSTAITTAQLADTYQVTGTLTCAVAAKTITEAGLFNTTTLSPTTSLAATVSSAGATSITLAAARGPTTLNFYMQIENEVVLVTGGQNTTLVTVTRGALGSTATTHPPAAIVTVGGDGGANANFGVGGQTATVNAAQGGDMFIHADFAGIALNVNDSIAFTFKDQLT